jgi:hypothetical protein
MRSVLGIGLVLGIVVLGGVGVAGAQDGLTKQDRQGPVTVAITLAAPPAVGEPVRAKVVLDTHSVGLDGIAFDQVVAVRASDGAEQAPTAVEQVTGSGHHRQAVLVFPPLAAGGPLQIVVRNVGGVAERSFVWEFRPGR